jgi:hypothetical protein
LFDEAVRWDVLVVRLEVNRFLFFEIFGVWYSMSWIIFGLIWRFEYEEDNGGWRRKESRVCFLYRYGELYGNGTFW